MTGRQLSYEDFADKLGQLFPIAGTDEPHIPLTLTEAEVVDVKTPRPGMRHPFSLTFVAKDPRVLPQRIYRLAHDGLGELDIFLVPIGKNADGVAYQAMFN